MRVEQVIPILNVADVDASLVWFAKLGFTRSFDWNESGDPAAAVVRAGRSCHAFTRMPG
jgi:hypothetical protein